MPFDPENPSYGGQPGGEKGVLQATYFNAASLAKEIEEIGFRGIQTLDLYGLAGYPGREKIEIEGNGIILAPEFVSSIPELQSYNVGLNFGVSFNGFGTDDGDDWINFTTLPAGVPPFATPQLCEIRNVIFHRIWIRNNTTVAVAESKFLRLYVIQDVSFIEQVNKLLRNVQG